MLNVSVRQLVQEMNCGELSHVLKVVNFCIDFIVIYAILKISALN